MGKHLGKNKDSLRRKAVRYKQKVPSILEKGLFTSKSFGSLAIAFSNDP